MKPYFSSVDAWKELLSCDFNSGYVAGAGLVLAILLLFLVLKIVFRMIFRNRRCRFVLIPAQNGDVQISEEAILSAIRSLLFPFPEFSLESLKIYRRGKHHYRLCLQGSFESGETAFPATVAQIKEAVFRGMEQHFGIRDLREVRIVLRSFVLRKSAAQESPEIPVS